MMIEFAENNNGAKIKVVGIGGGGCNAVDRMITAGLRGVEFIGINTDYQALKRCRAKRKILLGEGLGAGANPEVGRKAATEAADEIAEELTGADMVFVTAGMGGGTGTGGAPVIAKMARELGALTVSVVTKPFHFEGKKRMLQAEQGIHELREGVDTVIIIPNQRLLAVAEKQTALFTEAFKLVDEVLLHAVQGIAEIITVPGLINADFADVRSVMSERGGVLMGIGIGKGEFRATEAVNNAISHPLLENSARIDGASGVLINITGGPDLTLQQVNEAASVIWDAVDEDANIIFGAVHNESMLDVVRITVIATGLGKENQQQAGEAKSTLTLLDYSEYSKKTLRKKSLGSAGALRNKSAESSKDVDRDYPAFLRYQAD